MSGRRSCRRSHTCTRSSGRSTPLVPTRRSGPRSLLAVLGEGGFDGVVAVEWGGSAWLDADEVDAFDLVARHGSFCRAVISNGVPEVATRT